MAENIIEYKDYDDYRMFWDFMWGSYAGGPGYKNIKDAFGKEVFIEHELEADNKGDRRLRHSTYKNYARVIADKYRDFVYRNEIVWPVPKSNQPRLTAFLQDCDNDGMPFPRYMRTVTKLGQIFGEVLVGIDAPEIENAASPATQKQADALGAHAYLVIKDIRLMVDYEADGLRGFSRIVLKEETRSKPSLDTKEEVTTEYIEWTPGEWTRYDEDGKKLKSAPHRFGCVPIWRHLHNSDGESQLTDIAECSRKIFNLSSLLDEELYSRTFTQIFITGEGIQSGNIKQVVGGNSNVIVIPVNADVHFKGADPKQAESIREAIAMEIKEIYRQAGIESGDPTEVRQPESGIAREWAFHSVEQQLKSIADTSEDTANFLLQRLIEQGVIEGDTDTKVDYPDKFDVTAFKDDLENALMMMTGIDNFPLTAKQELTRKLINKSLPKLDPAIAQQIEKEIKQMKESGFMDFNVTTEEE